MWSKFNFWILWKLPLKLKCRGAFGHPSTNTKSYGMFSGWEWLNSSWPWKARSVMVVGALQHGSPQKGGHATRGHVRTRERNPSTMAEVSGALRGTLPLKLDPSGNPSTWFSLSLGAFKFVVSENSDSRTVRLMVVGAWHQGPPQGFPRSRLHSMPPRPCIPLGETRWPADAERAKWRPTSSLCRCCRTSMKSHPRPIAQPCAALRMHPI